MTASAPTTSGRAGPPRRTSRFYFWTPKQVMIDLDYLIDGFEGLAMIRTRDTRIGLLEALVTPGLEEEFLAVAQEILRAYPEVRLAPRRSTRPTAD